MQSTGHQTPMSQIDYEHLADAFRKRKAKAKNLIERHNDPLRTEQCHSCLNTRHCPGLPCPVCGYEHKVSWVISLDTEFGYDVVEIRSRKKIIASFTVPSTFR